MQVRLSHIRGVALIQVLLITALLLLLMIQLTKDGQRQVAVAQQWQDKSQALLLLEDAKELLLFELLTRERTTSDESAVTRRWNFFGNPFYLANGVRVRIYDEGSLPSLFYSSDIIERMLVKQGVSAEDARASVQALMLWQGANESIPVPAGWRGKPIQFFGELDFIPGVNAGLIPRHLVTSQPVKYFNPLMAPRELLAALLPDDRLNALISAREQGVLTNEVLRSMESIGVIDNAILASGNILHLELIASYNDVSVTREFIIKLQPEGQPTISFLSK